MYIKIQNNILTDWADWAFDGSTFVNIDYDFFNNNKDRYIVENGELVDIYETEEYQKKKRIKEIDAQLTRLDNLYYLESQKPVDFNGHQYKFDWTTLYQNILDSGILPAKIWDISELEENAVIMDKENLQGLQDLLLSYQEAAFQTRKEARSILLKEKGNLEN